MNIRTAETELAEFLVRLEKATWNRPRTNEELQGFLSSKTAILGDVNDSLFAQTV